MRCGIVTKAVKSIEEEVTRAREGGRGKVGGGRATIRNNGSNVLLEGSRHTNPVQALDSVAAEGEKLELFGDILDGRDGIRGKGELSEALEVL